MHDIQLLIKKVDCVYLQHQSLDCFLIYINSIYCTQSLFEVYSESPDLLIGSMHVI